MLIKLLAVSYWYIVDPVLGPVFKIAYYFRYNIKQWSCYKVKDKSKVLLYANFHWIYAIIINHGTHWCTMLHSLVGSIFTSMLHPPYPHLYLKSCGMEISISVGDPIQCHPPMFCVLPSIILKIICRSVTCNTVVFCCTYSAEWRKGKCL